MQLDKYFRKYVWDEQRTPYFVPVERLTRRQTEYEIHFYALATGVLFTLVSLAALSDRLPHGNAQIVSLFAFTQVCAALLLGLTRSTLAALYCATAPIAGLAYFAVFGFHPTLGGGDKLLLVAAMIGWLWYARRLIAVARAWARLAGPLD